MKVKELTKERLTEIVEFLTGANMSQNNLIACMVCLLTEDGISAAIKFVENVQSEMNCD